MKGFTSENIKALVPDLLALHNLCLPQWNLPPSRYFIFPTDQLSQFHLSSVQYWVFRVYVLLVHLYESFRHTKRLKRGLCSNLREPHGWNSFSNVVLSGYEQYTVGSYDPVKREETKRTVLVHNKVGNIVFFLLELIDAVHGWCTVNREECFPWLVYAHRKQGTKFRGHQTPFT